MAKAAILEVLEKSIGKYVLNLDAKSLNVAIWSGRIELDDLKLDINAINRELYLKATEAPNLAAPYRVVEGSLSVVRVEIPWARISSKPVVFRASGLNVLVEPYDHLTGDQSTISSKEVSAKSFTAAVSQQLKIRHQNIKSADDNRRSINALRNMTVMDESDNGSEKGPGFTKRLVRRIIENLQVEISDLNIQICGVGCSAGIVLHTLSLATTDETGKQMFIDRTNRGKNSNMFLHKVLDIIGLGIYIDKVDDNAEPAVQEEVSSDHSYLLSPLTFQAKLRISDSEQCVDFPKYLLSSEISSIWMTLSRQQLELSKKIAIAITAKKSDTRPLFPEYRPSVPVSKESAKLWWKYSFRCVGRLDRRRSWYEFFIAFKKRKAYILLYKRFAHHESCPWIEPLNDLEKTELKKIEEDHSLSIDGIMVWRNIADAQAEGEKQERVKQEKSSTSGMLSRMIGRKNQQEKDVPTEPLFELSSEDMRELEESGLAGSSGSPGSVKGKLYDTKFTLGSFQVDLVASETRPLLSLRMGTALTSFIANTDGSFNFGFSLENLTVDDKVTKKSFLPHIMNSLTTNGIDNSTQNALEIKLKKSKNGDQDLTLKLVAFELVAAPLMIKEVKKFFSFSNEGITNEAVNPEVAKEAFSSRASSDIFYDAQDELTEEKLTAIINEVKTEATTAAADRISDAFSDMWKSKQQKKTALSLNCEINAPIILVPSNCVDPKASVLILNLGTFHFLFGKVADSNEDVHNWFQEHSLPDRESEIENCSISAANLSLLIGNVGDQDWRTDIVEGKYAGSGASEIIERIFVSINIGIQSFEDADLPARICVKGEIPGITLQVTSGKMSRMLSVVTDWSEDMKEEDVSAASNELSRLPAVDEDAEFRGQDKDTAFDSCTEVEKASQQNPSDKPTDSEVIELFYLSMTMKKFSVVLTSDDGGTLESHLVCVKATATTFTDKSSSIQLAMGYFWILDRFAPDLPRIQRLVAHSRLPKSAAEFSKDDSYDVIQELQRLGLFAFNESNELADIRVNKSPPCLCDSSADTEVFNTDVNATFSSVFINYNPTSVNRIVAAIQKVFGDDSVDKRKSQSNGQFTSSPKPSSRRSEKIARRASVSSKASPSSLRVHAEIPSLELSLRSGGTDEELFLVGSDGGSIKYCAPIDKDAFAEVTLSRMWCEARKLTSKYQMFSEIFSPYDESNMNKNGSTKENMMQLKYSKSIADGPIDVELTFGSTQFVISPETLTDAFEFIKCVSESSGEAKNSKPEPAIDYSSTDLNKQDTEDLSVSPKATQTIKLSIKTSDCLFVLVDRAATFPGALKNNDLSSVAMMFESTESFVFQGKTDLTVSLELKNSPSRSIDCSAQLDGIGIQMFLAQGPDFRTPIQILEPMSYSISVAFNETSNREISVKLNVLSDIAVDFSMENAALLISILSSIRDSVSDKPSLDDGSTGTIKALDDGDAQRIQRIATELDEPTHPDSNDSANENVEFESQAESERDEDQPRSDDTQDKSYGEKRQIFQVSVVLPLATFTIINDLQGLDEGLFKFIIGDIQFTGDACTLLRTDTVAAVAKGPLFHCNGAITLIADYFDSHTNFWEPLLVKPWGITLSGSRGPSKRCHALERMSTVFGIESDSCHISFSEQMLVSIGAVQKMWSVYSDATLKATSIIDHISNEGTGSKETPVLSPSLKRSMASTTARSVLTTESYKIENHCGLMIDFENKEEAKSRAISGSRRSCASGSESPIRFLPPKGMGIGGKRAYGQDVTHFKALNLFVAGRKISIPHIDEEVGRPRRAHPVGEGRYIFIDVVKTARSTVIRVKSQMEIHNDSTLSFDVTVKIEDKVYNLGTCLGVGQWSDQKTGESETGLRSSMRARIVDLRTGCNSVGVPTDVLPGSSCVSLFVSPLPSVCSSYSKSLLPENRPPLYGKFLVPSLTELANSGSLLYSQEVTCSSQSLDEASSLQGLKDNDDDITLQICCRVTLIGGKRRPFVELFLQPRALLKNDMPVSLLVQSPIGYLVRDPRNNNKRQTDVQSAEEHIHKVNSKEVIEVFTSAPTVAFSVRCGDVIANGGLMGWANVNSDDLRLGSVKPLSKAVKCVFPFVNDEGDKIDEEIGTEFYLSEMTNQFGNIRKVSKKELFENQTPKEASVTALSLSNNKSEAQKANVINVQDAVQTFVLGVPNVGIDHTGNVTFERVAENEEDTFCLSVIKVGPMSQAAISSFWLPQRNRHVMLLPNALTKIRLVKSTDDEVKRSLPFCLDEIALCEGDVEFSPLLWDDQSPTGYYAYRQLSSIDQYEVHVVHEFLLYNGCKESSVVAKQSDSYTVTLDSGKRAPIYTLNEKHGMSMSFVFTTLNAETDVVCLSALGIKVCTLKSLSTGAVVGSVAVETELGNRDSRFVVKIGDIKLGRNANTFGCNNTALPGLFDRDFLRLRLLWNRLEVTLCDTAQDLGDNYEKNRAAIESALTRYTKIVRARDEKPSNDDHSSNEEDLRSSSYTRAASFAFNLFTVDYQRLFVDKKGSDEKDVYSLHRSQLSVIVHGVRISDCKPNSSHPVVLDSSYKDKSFFDLCIRTRGSKDSEIRKVDLFDLNLAYAGGKSEKIVLSTSENFIWRMLDIINRSTVAAAELAGVNVNLDWDSEREEYIVTVVSTSSPSLIEHNGDEEYKPPRSDALYDVKLARVSPISLLISFKRDPQASRYSLGSGGRRAGLMNYFTTRLKFTIKEAQLKFTGYSLTEKKGTSDSMLAMVKTFYLSKMKFKVLSLLSCASLQDWNHLAGRDDENEGYVEGDVLRLTGNLTGLSAGFLLKSVGEGASYGVSTLTRSIGGGVQATTEMLGVGVVGKEVNSIVTGAGEGVSDTVKGVGVGTGKILFGAGKGLGQTLGGVGGGLTQIAKGRVVDGGSSLVGGVGKGVSTIATETVGGVSAVGEGVWSGTKNIGRGIGGLFGGPKKQPERKLDGQR